MEQEQLLHALQVNIQMEYNVYLCRKIRVPMVNSEVELHAQYALQDHFVQIL
jgi:hypothetical protein